MKTVVLTAVALMMPLTAFAQVPPKCPEIKKAQLHLAQSRENLEHAAHDFKGHRVKALELVKQAEAELAQAAAVRGCR